MYKIVAVAGKIRGQEFVLPEGESTLGRSDDADIQLSLEGISKKHFSVTVSGETCFIKDLGSSNGTFLNGKAIDRATAKNGDKIALPDTIFQVVYVSEKKIVVKRKAAAQAETENDDWKTGGDAPKSLVAKIIWFFRYKGMSFIHGINQEYEWKSLFGIILALFCVSIITLTIFPVLQDSKKILLHETAIRGAHYADEIARINKTALVQKQLDNIDIKFLEQEDGIKDYLLFDLEGRIVRPITRLNQYIQDTFAVDTLNWAKQKSNWRRVSKVRLGTGEIGIGKTIMAFNSRVGREEPGGVIAIRFIPKSLKVEASKSQRAYLESLATTALVAIIFFGIIYFLTIRPIEEIRYQLEEGLRGNRKSIEGTYLMSEVIPLRNSLNVLLQRVRELSNEQDEEFTEMESDESYVMALQEMMRGNPGPCIVLNSEKNVAQINMDAEDLTGIRESSSQGQSILDVSREKGFAATVMELCDASAGNNGTNQEGQYELGGHDYSVHVASLMGKDGFAKAFYITFIKE